MATIMNGNVHHAESTGAHVKNGTDLNGTKLVKPLLNTVAQSDACNNVKQYVLEAIRDKQELYNMEQYAIDYAHSIGLVAPMPDQPKETFSNILAVPPPITLLPSPFPRELYEQAVDVQQQLSELYFRIASDHEFLMDSFKDVIKSDPFMARFVQIAKMVHEEGVHQPLAVQLQRSDYMIHLELSDGTLALKQVEVNIGPLGGIGSVTGVSKLHRKTLDKVAIVREGRLAMLANAYAPVDRTRQNLARSFYQTWKLFGDPKAILLFLDTPDLMYFEQRQCIQFEVEKLGKQDGLLVVVLSLPFVEASKRMSLDENGDFSLYMDGNKRVALVHITDGNAPDEFPTEREWTARTMMERSTAILSPNIRLQLSCTKKIQQVLAKPGMLERFIPNDSKLVAKLRSTFTGLWGLEEDDKATKEVIEAAIRSPRNYVLKSQMEAGLGNFFDEQIAEMLQKLSKQDRAAYILQQRINPLVVKNFMMRQMKPAQMEDVVSELGIYASLIGNQSTGQILHNSVDGHTIRSKPSKVNQGGVVFGGGTIDSALLFPAAEMLEAQI
uniref:Glutathione synthetase n=1 Tax=Globodera rostochiensis TaxID=31243 RepID=A0A914H9I9_GLORO